MPISVLHNAAAVASANRLGETRESLQSTLGRVASGSRINESAADTAGAAVSVNLNAKASSTLAAIRNARDGQSMIQVSEAALDETANIIERLRELAVQSSSGTLEDGERAYVSAEFNKFVNEIKRISQNGKFNDQTVVTGETYGVHVGTGGDSIDDTIRITTADIKTLYTGLSVVSIADASDARTGLGRIDIVLDLLNKERSRMGALHNRLDNAISHAHASHENLRAASSRIEDADFASETAKMTALKVKQQAGMAALSQANQLPATVIDLI
jgi:flagellin